MKKNLLCFSIGLCTLSLVDSPALGQGTAFTYQGRLDNNGAPVSGRYDLQFTLFATNITGAAIAGPLTNAATAVSNGLFTCAIDFGQGVFTGVAYWLDIAVRTNGGGAFTELAPRQPLTPAPYSVFADAASELISGLSIQQNTDGAPNVIGGSPVNFVAGGVVGATIGGGGATNYSGNVYTNSVTGDFGTVGGGDQNTASGGATVAGGQQNIATNGDATVGGGYGNTAGGFEATVGGGNQNTASGYASTVAGGDTNTASGGWATVAGGFFNVASNDYSFAAGNYAHALHQGAFVWADSQGPPFASTTDDEFSIRAQGGVRISSGVGVHLNGAFGPIVVRDYDPFAPNATEGKAGLGRWGMFAEPSTLALGIPASDAGARYFQVVTYNTNGTPTPVMQVDQSGNVLAQGTVTANGMMVNGLSIQQNANGGPNVIGGSHLNYVGSGVVGATIGGGGATNYDGFVYSNSVTETFGTVGGGGLNTASGFGATVGGGIGNKASGDRATVGGGMYNTATNDDSTVGGGVGNTASGYYATVSGGYSNTASGNYSFAAGGNATASDNNSFVWGDTSRSMRSQGANSFTVLATGGVYLYTTPNGTDVVLDNNGNLNFGATTRQMLNLWSTAYGIGVQNNDEYFRTAGQFGQFYWFSGGSHNNTNGNSGGGTTLMSLSTSGLTVSGTVVSGSDRNLKEHFQPVDAVQVLARVAALPISRWNYKADTASQHIGPVAQDFYGAFGVGPDDKHIATIDEGGVALAAIQGLNQKLEQKETEIMELKTQLNELKDLVRAMNHKPN
jgi:hypothetical protein